MALYNMVSEKLCRGKYFSNRYTISAASLDAAVAVAAQIRHIEELNSYSHLTLTKYRVSDRTPHTDVYTVVTDSLPGARAIPEGGDDLPLFCRVRMDFNVATGGRPSRKYFCPPLLEAETVAGDLSVAAKAWYQAHFANPLVAIDGFVDVDGQAIASGVVVTQVGMRQLRRGSKRKVTPIL